MDSLEQKELIELITALVLKEAASRGIEIQKERRLVPVSVSARHIHLKQEHLELLFVAGFQLTKFRDISQPGQFAAAEKVTLMGPSGSIENVRVLGPLRKETQVEISISDARVLGINPVVRRSGDLKGTPGIIIKGPKGTLKLSSGCITAERHIHMTLKDSLEFGVTDGEKVTVKVPGDRGGILENVFIRLSKDFALDMHIDTDDSNAFLIKNGDMLEIIK